MDIFLYWCPGPIVYAPSGMGREVPWVPEAFHARFPLVSVRPSAEHVAACGRQDEAPRRAREKTSGTQGRREVTCIQQFNPQNSFYIYHL